MKRFDRTVRELVLGLCVLLALVAFELWLAAAVFGLFLAWAMWRAMNAQPAPHGEVEPEVKTYPLGCSCVRGALLDNPRCPHHGDLFDGPHHDFPHDEER